MLLTIMALIKCTSCGHMISDKASKCPKCGTPITIGTTQKSELPEKPRENTHGFVRKTANEATSAASNYQKEIPSTEKRSNNTVLYVIIGILVVALIVLGFFMLKSEKNESLEEEKVETQVVKIEGHYDISGSIGTYNVEMKLDVNNGNATGLYHYDFQKQGTNLSLSGQCEEDGTLTLNETTPSGTKSGRFVGKFDGKIFSGTFYNLIKGTTFPFSLTVGATPKMDSAAEEAAKYDEAVTAFVKEMFDKKMYENYSWLHEHCTETMLHKLAADYEYDEEGGYAVWRFRSEYQDGPSERYGIISVKNLGDGWYNYTFYDMGNEDNRSIKLIKKGNSFMIDGLK